MAPGLFENNLSWQQAAHCYIHQRLVVVRAVGVVPLYKIYTINISPFHVACLNCSTKVFHGITLSWSFRGSLMFSVKRTFKGMS